MIIISTKHNGHVIMLRRTAPKTVNLPNGRSLISCYRRTTRNQLPENVKTEKTYKQRVALKIKDIE